jgi:hypothetical protein
MRNLGMRTMRTYDDGCAAVVHPQAQLAGEDLETLLLTRMDVIRSVVQPGSPIQSTPSSSPFGSRADFRNTVCNRLTGLTCSSPALATPSPPLPISVSTCDQSPLDSASTGITYRQPCSDL